MKILGTGMTGLVGSRIVELLKDQYEFEFSDIDITNKNAITQKIKGSDARVVLHLAAKTDVDGCEKDSEKDISFLSLRGAKNERQSNPQSFEIASLPSGARNDIELEKEWFRQKTAWAVNVLGSKNVAQACEKSNKKLIYISTDFVFDGTNPPDGGYSEEDIPNPINWYGKTKYEGEKIVQNLSTPWLIIRIAYPYRANFKKSDFFRAILKRLDRGKTVMGVIDHIFTPTFIDDIAFAVDRLIKQEKQGLFHVVGSQALSPFEAAVVITNVFRYNQKLITKTTRSQFFKNRASRPFQLFVNNDKIRRLGTEMRGFEEGIRDIKDQILNIKDNKVNNF